MDPSREDAIHNERHVKVICVGAGASGLCLAYKLQRSFTNYSLTVSLALSASHQTLMPSDLREKPRRVRHLVRKPLPRLRLRRALAQLRLLVRAQGRLVVCVCRFV